MVFRLPTKPDKIGLGDMRYERKGTKPKPYKNVVVEGWDTETRPDGFAWVLANSEEWMEVTSWWEALEFLTLKRRRGNRNFWWNLDFDVTALLKWNPEAWYMVTKEGNYYDYEEKAQLFYIPKKLLKVTKGKKTFLHYDIWQFYNTSLAVASWKYLGKKEHNLKSVRAGLWGAWQNGTVSLEEVGGYCAWDARRTRELAERYIGGLHRVGLYPRHFISKGNLAEHATRVHGDVPIWSDVPYYINRLGWDCYRGGWFDLWKKGTMDVWKYDIKSAYPFVQRNLPDFRYGEWVEEYVPESLVGFVVCDLEATRETPPMISSWFGTSHLYCDLDQTVRVVLANSEYEYLRKRSEIKVIDAHSFVPSEVRYPWREVIDKFLILKEEAKNDPPAYSASKEVVNSGYGKTCQVVRKKDENGQKYYEAGKLFCPAAAAIITAGCRVQVAEAIGDYLEDVVMVATDSVTMLRPLGLDIGTNVGQWEIEASGEEGLFVKPGVYQIETDMRPHTRGFKPGMRKDGKFRQLKEFCRTDEHTFEVEWTSPVSSRMAFHRKDYRMANVWESIPRKIKANDHRRLWERRVTFRELLKNQIGSKAVPLSLFGTTELRR
jgi:hypothetical protein